MKAFVRTENLLYKYGFFDGDLFEHDYLVEIVENQILPELRKHHTFEYDVFLTSHNPIRLRIVDGNSKLDAVKLIPEMVQIEFDEKRLSPCIEVIAGEFMDDYSKYIE